MLHVCPRVINVSLRTMSSFCDENFKSINLSRYGAFLELGLLNLVGKCRNLVEIDESNAMNLKNSDAALLSKARYLEKLWIGRWCMLVTDMGVGCISIGIGCRKLKLISYGVWVLEILV